MDKLANAIVGFNLINKYQPNTNQWKRIVELFNEEFNLDGCISDEEHELIEFLKLFANTNEMIDSVRWKQLINLSEAVIKSNNHYGIPEYDEDEIYNDLDIEKNNYSYIECDYISQEEADDIVYRLANATIDEKLELTNDKHINDILNQFVISSYMEPSSQLKLKF